MSKIQTDEHGRRYVERVDGTRVYVPRKGDRYDGYTPAVRRRIEATHRAFADTVQPDDKEERRVKPKPTKCGRCERCKRGLICMVTTP